MTSRSFETYRAGHDAFNQRDFAAMVKHYADSIDWTDRARGLTFRTPQEFKDVFLPGWVESSSNIRITDPRYIDAGQTVMCTFTVVGTHDGPLGPLPATGKEFALPLCEMWHFDSERAGRRWGPLLRPGLAAHAAGPDAAAVRSVGGFEKRKLGVGPAQPYPLGGDAHASASPSTGRQRDAQTGPEAALTRRPSQQHGERRRGWRGRGHPLRLTFSRTSLYKSDEAGGLDHDLGSRQDALAVRWEPGTSQARAERRSPRPGRLRRSPRRTRGPGRSGAYNCDDFPLPDGTTAQDYLRLPERPLGPRRQQRRRETVREEDIDPKNRMTSGIQEGPPAAL